MKERPILFSSPMVIALLAGTKTQTRRVFKVRDPAGQLHVVDSPREEIHRFTDGTFHYLSTYGMSGPYPCPYGVPSDRLWVRETFSYQSSDIGKSTLPVWYWADGNPLRGDWTRPYPSIHMPRYASRINLEVTDVRVERLQDISEADAEAEGCGSLGRDIARPSPYDAAKLKYASLWEQINGAGSWAENPWVWCVSFKRVIP